MGNLPPERVNPNPVFSNTGVDFCGPFLIRYKNQRKGKLHKVYVAIFACLVTKAIHLEIVFDLTSQAFIACLKRFFSRRGKCSTLFSDKSKSFIGANKELKKLASLVNFPDEILSRFLAMENISWKFLPPRAPNFGGLWESGVKSFKHHLKRTVADAKLFYEEFLTVITQIEGILNSRPIPPFKWCLGKISQVIPGQDGKIRVVIVKTKNGHFKRPISKICLLPIET
ncbi:uncharacterized protein LOC129971878 [Argiope bruennichi]|uniref:uncharacterized protein LOC129971878 n=1 Tax=Argiope bruennichi TaxID=94029 RepID=UPI002494965C|nr:uncharacterized protein LOC129971878 [Argiope bruennichi]